MNGKGTSVSLSHVNDTLAPDAVVADHNCLSRLQQVCDQRLHAGVPATAGQQRVLAVRLEHVLQPLLDLCTPNAATFKY